MEKNKRDNLTKKDIANTIYSYFGVSTLYARKILDDTINILIAGLKKNGTLKINKFGSFKVNIRRKELEEIQKINKCMKLVVEK